MLLYQIQAILNLKFTVSNTSNKQKASRRWVEWRWRETIDYKSNRSEILCWGSLYQIQAILSHCCIKYKELAKGQKDDGRRETWRTINKQKNKSCLFVNLFGCFHDSEHDIVQHFAGWLAYYSWCWVWKWVSIWKLDIGPHSLDICVSKFLE